jgi:hypothetical protein
MQQKVLYAQKPTSSDPANESDSNINEKPKRKTKPKIVSPFDETRTASKKSATPVCVLASKMAPE